AASGADVLAVRSTKVPASVIESSDALKLIIRGGAGFDNIDCDVAGARGVPVCNCPGMNAVAVAELAMGHMLNLDRRIAEQTSELVGGQKLGLII
ncbi:MAG: hydroxyacid dehydrogenase, partial [Blastopirellula sp.]